MKLRLPVLSLIVVSILIFFFAMPVAAQDGQTHTVQPGENLASIAARYNVTMESLMQFNNITNANYIQRGTVLVIPPTGGVALTGATQTYTVQRGDSLYTIALRYQTTPEILLASNSNIVAANAITAGMTITVPALAGTTTTTTTPVTQQTTTVTQQTTYVQPTVYTAPVIQPRRVVNGYYHVQYGDTMLAIARSFNIDVWNLARANGIYNLNLIYAGQYLRVPGYY
ncbi:MAG: LysM peptidoglycan-binding domain-containing protein [Aggregatilineales bacterium]